MLYLAEQHANALWEHAKAESPNEACGLLAGRGKRVAMVYRMTNIKQSPTTFFMEPKQQFKVIRDIRNRRLQPVAIYHSHPATAAYPSVHDVAMAHDSSVSYVIVSLLANSKPRIRSYRIIEGNIEEEHVIIARRSDGRHEQCRINDDSDVTGG